MAAKRFNNVSDLIKDVSDDIEFSKKFQEKINSRQLSKSLFTLRCNNGYTQAEFAKKIGCSQARISKIEHSTDDKLSVKDIVDYCKATDNTVDILFVPQKKNMVERVKRHYFVVKDSLDKMCELSKGDEQFTNHVHSFTVEASLNIISGLAECLERFKAEPEKPEILQIASSTSVR